MKNKLVISFESFHNFLLGGRECIQNAAEVLVGLVDRDPRVYEKLITMYPDVSIPLLATLEKVGRGKIYSALLFDGSPGARRLLTLPYAQQKQNYDNPISIVVSDGKKKIVIQKKVSEMSPPELRIAIADDHVRTVTEQSKLISHMVTAPIRNMDRYTILPNGNVIFFENVEFTPPQLEDVYKRVMKASIKSLEKSGSR
jgi:hypothetical protein